MTMSANNLSIGVTSEDVNQVISENPMVGLQLRIAVLTRTIEEQRALIDELKSQTKTKKGS